MFNNSGVAIFLKSPFREIDWSVCGGNVWDLLHNYRGGVEWDETRPALSWNGCNWVMEWNIGVQYTISFLYIFAFQMESQKNYGNYYIMHILEKD